MTRRRCLVGGPRCSGDGWAVLGASRCRAHGGKAWAGLDPSRQQAYRAANWTDLRRIVLEREPQCHWRYPGCTFVSTEADHVVPVARGGSSSLDNLVGSCRRCNLVRAGREGAASAARRRKAHR